MLFRKRGRSSSGKSSTRPTWIIRSMSTGRSSRVVEHERDGKVSKPPYLAWKDTVNVARGETVRLLLRQERPGPRMYHCHILEHEQLGMMGIVDVQA
ncbi:multicopper oxidase domain-containing protein (plasmid) [Mesorhizobium atlanticum]|uniref:multicopper oxidase domain-containing protein n=1 Tax=Mesorhizobium atlanticum TaxID=2233532 RepID=UPI003703A62D